jgi:hypothetical protein
MGKMTADPFVSTTSEKEPELAEDFSGAGDRFRIDDLAQSWLGTLSSIRRYR